MNKSILLIEDNESILDNMKEILELSDYKVITAVNGKEGVAMAIQHKPDLIVCDIMMPVLDGYGVIHMLQRNADTQNIPFIFLTAKAERNEIRKGMELGADDYIMKPFNGTELLNAIESRIRKAALINAKIAGGLEGLDFIATAVNGKDKLPDITTGRTVSKFKKKQIIYAEGGNPLNMYFVISGRVKVYKCNDEGKELVTGLYTQGDFLGYVALIDRTVYKETAEALEETEIAVIPRHSFEELIYNNREVMKKFIRLLANNVSAREEQLLSLAYNSLRKKVADALVSIYNKYSCGNTGFIIEMSREDLANIAGAAKESVIRTLGDFKEEKLIDINHGDIVILDNKRLERLAN